MAGGDYDGDQFFVCAYKPLVDSISCSFPPLPSPAPSPSQQSELTKEMITGEEEKEETKEKGEVEISAGVQHIFDHISAKFIYTSSSCLAEAKADYIITNHAEDYGAVWADENKESIKVLEEMVLVYYLGLDAPKHGSRLPQLQKRKAGLEKKVTTRPAYMKDQASQKREKLFGTISFPGMR